jgi:hypothetical protein
MKKLSIGKKTMSSVKLQVVSILQSLHKTDVHIDAIEPVRFDRGNYFLVRYHTKDERNTPRSRYFAHQKVRDCCDVWLESPTAFPAAPHGGNAA